MEEVQFLASNRGHPKAVFMCVHVHKSHKVLIFMRNSLCLNVLIDSNSV